MTAVTCTINGCPERAVTYPSAIGVHYCEKHWDELKHQFPEEI